MKAAAKARAQCLNRRGAGSRNSRNSRNRLEGYTALVAGAGRRLGAPIARELAACDVRLCRVGRDERKLDAVVDSMEAEAGFFSAVTDISSLPAVSHVLGLL